MHQPKRIPMSDSRRDLILRVTDGEAGVLPVMHAITAWTLCDRMLFWMITNKLVGRNLLSYFQTAFNGNRINSMIQEIEMRTLGLEEPRPIIRGVNWLG